jgi:hypothetical protein
VKGQVAQGRESRRTTILIVSQPSIARFIELLFRGHAEFEVVGTLAGLGSLGRQSGRLLPQLIIANVKPVSSGICRVVAAIKRSSPLSKLILTCPVEDSSRLARKHGADAYLKNEMLAGQLLRVARSLSERAQVANSGD